MIEYTYNQLDNEDYQLVVNGEKKIIFFLSLNEERKGLFNEILIKDFENVENIEYFVSLLLEDTDTAYLKYLLTKHKIIV